MKKGLAVFSGSAVVHKLMQDGTVQFGSGSNLASVVISGSLTASADSIEVSSVRGNFTNTTLGGILVELKQSGSTGLSDLDTSLRTYINAQDIVVGNAAAAALGAYTASNNTAHATEVADRIAGDNSVRSDLSAALTASNTAASAALEGVRSDLQGQIDVLAGADLSGTLSSIADIKSFLDGEAGGVEGILTGFNDLSIAVNAISGALSQEIIDRAADVDTEQQRAEGAEATLTSDLTAEVTRATGAEATLTSDLAAEAVARVAADSTEQLARQAADTALQSNIDAEAILRAAGDNTEKDRAEAAELVLTQAVSTEASRAQLAEAGLAGDIADVANNLATETANRIADVDAEKDRAEAAELVLTQAIAAEVIRAEGAEGVLQDNIDAEAATRLAADDALDDRIDGVAADLATEQARAEGAEGVLQSAINTEKDRIDAILSLSDSDKDSFKEIVDLINSVDTTSDTAFAGYVLSNNAAVADVRTVLSSSITGALTAVSDEASRAMASEGDIRSVLSSSVTGALLAVTAEHDRASGIEAGLQSQIDASAFQVNGMSVDAKSGSFTIVTGSSNNLTISNSGRVVTVDLNSSVTLAGTLSANVVSASAGLSVVGGASVAGGMTVSSGDMTVSSGDMKVSQGAMSVKMTREEAVARGPGEDGDMFYCTSATDNPASAFPRGKAWYFKQNGDWFDAPFYGEG